MELSWKWPREQRQSCRLSSSSLADCKWSYQLKYQRQANVVRGAGVGKDARN
jgi:hypothetical protein